MFALHGEPSIGLQPMVFSDGPTGVRGTEFVGGRQVALLPNATLLAQSWDETAAQRVGELLAGEALAQGVHVVLGADGQPAPQPARRPALRGVRGGPAAQRPAGGGVRPRASSATGWAAASSTTWPTSPRPTGTPSTRVVSEAALRELYLLPFEICVADAHPWTIMAAYNDVNGVAATEHDELNNVRAQGRVGLGRPADVGLVRDQDRGPGGQRRARPGDARPGRAVGRGPGRARCEAGEVSEQTIDEHLTPADPAGRPGRGAGRHPGRADRRARRPARARPMRWSGMRCATWPRAGWCCSRARTCCRWTQSAITDQSPVVLVGEPAVHTALQGGGSASVRPPHEISIAHGLTEALGVTRVRVVDGVGVRQIPLPAAPDHGGRPADGQPRRTVRQLRCGGRRAGLLGSEVAQLTLGMGTGPHEGAAAAASCRPG